MTLKRIGTRAAAGLVGCASFPAAEAEGCRHRPVVEHL